MVRIYCVLIHGAFEARVRLHPDQLPARGFYTSRWVLAHNEAKAREKAFQSAREELNEWSDVRDGLVAVRMDAEQVGPGSIWRWLKGGGKGFSFYIDD